MENFFSSNLCGHVEAQVVIGIWRVDREGLQAGGKVMKRNGGRSQRTACFYYLVVSNILYFHPYLGKIPILTNIFQMGWNHQPVLPFPFKKTIRFFWAGLGGGGFKHFLCFMPKIGEDGPHFDEHIFQLGWFNHQLV